MKRPDIIRFATDPELWNVTLSPAQETLLRAMYGTTPDQGPEGAVARLYRP